MANFTFNPNIPATNNNPSVDQPDMQTNNQAENDIWEVDHVGFNASNGGTHLQLTLETNNVPGGSPTGTQSIIYTNAGTASSSSNAFIKNPSGTFPMSIIKACGTFIATNSTNSFVTQFNCASIAYSNPGTNTYTITLTTNATTGNNVIVLCDSSTGNVNDVPAWSFSSNVLTISAIRSTVSAQVSFVILQV